MAREILPTYEQLYGVDHNNVDNDDRNFYYHNTENSKCFSLTITIVVITVCILIIFVI